MATKTLTDQLRYYSHWVYRKTDDISAPVDDTEYPEDFSFANGGGDSEIRYMFRERRTLLGNSEQAYDLAGGLVDVFGDTLTMTTLKQLVIYNRNTGSGEDLKFGQLASPTSGNLLSEIFDGDTDVRVKIKAGARFDLLAPLTGYTITGGSADVLLVSNEGAAAVTYDIIIKGT